MRWHLVEARSSGDLWFGGGGIMGHWPNIGHGSAEQILLPLPPEDKY